MPDTQKSLKSALAELSQFSIFQGFSSAAIESLCHEGQVIFSPHRETLFRFGEEAHFFGMVMSGAYKLSRATPQGDDAIVHFTTVGDVVGAFIMAQEKPCYPVSVTAMGPSRFLKIPRQNYLRDWKQHSDLILRIQNLLSTRMSQMHSQKALIKAPLAAKVAALIVDLLHRHEDSEALVLPLPLTRREIADNLGASVESVIRVMSEWSKQGFIQTTDQQIRILKLEKVIDQIQKY